MNGPPEEVSDPGEGCHVEHRSNCPRLLIFQKVPIIQIFKRHDLQMVGTKMTSNSYLDQNMQTHICTLTRPSPSQAHMGYTRVNVYTGSPPDQTEFKTR